MLVSILRGARLPYGWSLCIRAGICNDRAEATSMNVRAGSELSVGMIAGVHPGKPQRMAAMRTAGSRGGDAASCTGWVAAVPEV